MRYYFFYLRLLFFDPWPLLAILKTLLSFLNLVQYIFTCVFKFCFHACYFFIHDCNTFGGNMIPYWSPSPAASNQATYKVTLHSVTDRPVYRAHAVLTCVSLPLDPPTNLLRALLRSWSPISHKPAKTSHLSIQLRPIGLFFVLATHLTLLLTICISIPVNKPLCYITYPMSPACVLWQLWGRLLQHMFYIG